VKACAPTVTVPVRLVVAVFAATVRATVPLPLPLAPALIVIHEAPLAAVQPHPAAAVTVTVVLPAAPSASAKLVGEIVYVQPTPVCVKVKVWPAIVTVPIRLVVAVFAVTPRATVPFPLPPAPAVIMTHEAPLVAVQPHPVAAVTATAVPPALSPIEKLVGEIA
jgi:hypothetical protein